MSIGLSDLLCFAGSAIRARWENRDSGQRQGMADGNGLMGWRNFWGWVWGLGRPSSHCEVREANGF